MRNSLERLLNGLTMYRVVLYGLLGLSAVSILLGAMGILDYSGLSLLASWGILGVSCAAANALFSRTLRVGTNIESSAITALILFFVLYPAVTLRDAAVLAVAGVLAMASKYLFAWHKKHIFNPAAFAAFVLGLFGYGAAVWWVGSVVLLPFMLVLGGMIVWKVRRVRLVGVFLAASIATILVYGVVNGNALPHLLLEVVTSWPIIFFATVMLTEPFTMPTTRSMQMVFGVLVGVLFGAQYHIGPVYSSPELALLVGNVFAFAVGYRTKFTLTLRERKQIAPEIYEFAFAPSPRPSFDAGQYLEWTLPHAQSDDRGNRRYFTIASSPTEPDMRLGVRITPAAMSSYKGALLSMKTGDVIMADQLAGDFTLAHVSTEKIVCIAGGIGVTPFRSIVQYLRDKKQHRDIVLYYACATVDGFAYHEVFEEAERDIGLRYLPVLSGVKEVPAEWAGRSGYITADMLKSDVPDYRERTYMLSGPSAMVNAYERMLRELGIPRRQIVKDYFPGF